MINPIEQFRVINAISPDTNNAGSTGAYISMKYVNKAWIVVEYNQVTTHATTVTPYQATAVAGTGAKVLASSSFNIWASEGCSSDDTLTKQTPAGSYTFTALTTGKKICIFQFEPGELDLANSFDCLGIQVTSTTSSNRVAAQYICQMRYSEADTPSVIFD